MLVVLVCFWLRLFFVTTAF